MPFHLWYNYFYYTAEGTYDSMKKNMFALLGIVLAAALLLGGCSAGNGPAAKDAAARFLKALYTVDANAVKAFPDFDTDAGTQPDPAAQRDAIEKLNGRFEKLATADILNKILMDSTYTSMVQACSQKHAVLRPQKIKITVTSVKDNVFGFDFDAAMKMTYSDGSTQKTDHETGQITVVRDGGLWKVSSFWLADRSLLFKPETT
jgi:PBP1b-binding outer membrane lipoprotein LpoB